MATLTTIFENKLFINVCNLPLTSGHPLIWAEFVFLKVGLISGRPLHIYHGMVCWGTYALIIYPIDNFSLPEVSLNNSDGKIQFIIFYYST